MVQQNKRSALAKWIRAILADGVVLTDAVKHYMDATFGTSDVVAVIESDSGGELDSLHDLLFFPDFEVQIAFEVQWGDDAFTAKDLAVVQDQLCEKPLNATLVQSSHQEKVLLTVPEFALRAFVKRLNITWQPAPQITQALAHRWHGRQGIRMRVHMRNARLDWHANQVQFMQYFLSKMPQEDYGTEACLIFLLTILSELESQSDAYQFLAAKKFFYFQSLCKAEDFERQRTSSNMEILMLQGNRAAHGSIAQWRQQMQWVDQICQALYGRTEFFEQPNDHHLTLPKGEEGQIVRDIIRKLS